MIYSFQGSCQSFLQKSFEGIYSADDILLADGVHGVNVKLGERQIFLEAKFDEPLGAVETSFLLEAVVVNDAIARLTSGVQGCIVLMSQVVIKGNFYRQSFIFNGSHKVCIVANNGPVVRWQPYPSNILREAFIVQKEIVAHASL